MKSKLFVLAVMFLTSIDILCVVHITLAQQSKTDSLLSILKTAKADTAKVNTLNAVANEFTNNIPDTAIYFGNLALALATKLNYKMGIANSYLNLGVVKMNIGDYEEALKNDNLALGLYNQMIVSESTDKSLILQRKAQAYNNIGIVGLNQGNYSEALKNHFAALKIRETLGNKGSISDSYNNIGTVYMMQGDYSEALKQFIAALKIREKIGDKQDVAVSYNNVGGIYYYLGNYPEALKNYFTSLKIQESIGYKTGIAGSYNNIGAIYHMQENYPEALKNYLAALAIREETGDKQGIAASHNNIGNIYDLQTNYAEALTNYESALKLYGEIGEKYGIAITHNSIGVNYGFRKNYPLALKNHFASLKIKKEIGDKQGIAISYNSIGNIYTKQKNNTEASKYLYLGLSLAQEIGSIEDIKENYNSLAILDSIEGNFKRAWQHYKMYITYRDSLFNEENTKKLVQSQMQYEFDIKETASKAEQEKKDAITKAQQDKKEALTSAEIKRQKLIKNSTLGGVGISGVFSFLLVYSFNRRRKTAFEKQVSQVEMKALRSQMNPHFIFNSLQSIKKYMLERDTENASGYLTKFSKVMRLILENSREQEVPLEKDLAALELYMQLEAIRFENKFKYEIEIDPEIDKENTLIPPMILQPFVENSILHGLRTKENGLLKIKIKKENDMILCSVEDNGIGREQSVKIETTEEKEHESLAMKITQERLNIISQLKKVKAAMNVFDLKNAENKPAGVKVELMLPYETAF